MTSKNIVRILAAVVDTRQLTLYKEDGDNIIIPQGDPRLRRIIDQATSQLVEKGQADVEIDLEQENSYQDFEKKGTGLVRFFRVAKEKLKNLFTPVVDEPVPVQVIGEVPLVEGDRTTLTAMDHIEAGIADAEKIIGIRDIIPEAPPTVKQDDGDHVPTAVLVKHEQTMAAVNEIIAHATPVSSNDFHERDVAKQGTITNAEGETPKEHADDTESHTIIAVVDNKIIPGMEKIKSQFSRAAKLGSTVGVENFLRRLASVIDNRGHSVDDLLKFLERADLPIAEDGTILIYKLLNRKGDKQYVDCHSGKVTQFVGAFVCMDEGLVDPSRSRGCSNGLHVARRGYLRSFSGNVCVLAKLAPEDVIAVPQYDANKMRVCGYHIIAELTAQQFNAVKNNQPITFDEAGKQLLAKAMSGDHIRRTHEVRVTGANGGGVVVKELAPDVKPAVVETVAPAPTFTMEDVPAQLISDAADATEQFGDDELERFRDEQEAKKAEQAPIPVAEALADPEEGAMDQPTDPKEVIKAVEQTVAKVTLSRKEQAAQLYAAFERGDIGSLDALIAFKKSAKKGWDVLGIPDPTATTLKVKTFTDKKEKVTVKPVKEKVATPKVFEKKGGPPPKVFDVPPVKAPAPSAGIIADVAGDGPPKQRIVKLLAIGLGSAGIAQAILTIKKQAKKSWEILGVSEAQVAEILKQTGTK